MAELNSRPYISLVIAARNDDHAGNTLQRMQAFFDAWLGQAKHYGVESEVIVVEWNSPPNQPKLADTLRWPTETHPCEIRFIEVPAEVHRRFQNAHVMPLHPLIAKNVGIRRARGEFVLATNPGIVFSPELMQLFAERRLEPHSLYRVDRHDVAGDIPAPRTADQLVAYCANHVQRVLAAEGQFQLGSDGLRKLDPEDIVASEAGIHFGPGCYPVESEGATRFRWMMNEAEISFERPPDAAPCLLLDAETGPSAGSSRVAVQFLSSSGDVLGAASFQGRAQLRLHVPAQISSARIRLRIQSQGLPLQRDPRRLDLRLLGVRWEDSRNSGWPTNRPAQEAGIHVRSVQPRQIQIELKPGAGSRLSRLDARVSDPAGNTLLQINADPLQMESVSEYLLTLDVGFELTGSPVSASNSRTVIDPDWILETADAKAGVDWTRDFLAPSPCASEMRNAAYLHTNGCGDFTLLSREDWHSLRGYAEFPIRPTHIDALFCYAAHHAGIRETILRAPLRIFHLQDLSGSGEALDDSGASAGVPKLKYDDVVKWINQMRRFDAPVIFTKRDWGLGDLEIEETVVQQGHLKRST